jgi:uncharacterized protein YdeI (YjbR/CyaY-like superfamily)
MRTIYVRDRAEWREWLQENAGKAKEAWLIYYKKESGKPRISYEDAVQEALCFGWIDGKTGKLDEERFVQRFTPRKPVSRWSPHNIRRVKKLIHEGKMTPAGLAVFHPERETEPHPTRFPKELAQEFSKHREAWKNFQSFPPYYQRRTTAWVASAKKAETQRKRLRKLLDFSAKNERIKFM